jgi:hypothetical protein
MPQADLQAAVSEFAAEIQDLLDSVLLGRREVRAVRQGDKYVVRTGLKAEPVALRVQDESLATLGLSFRCRLDHVGEYLAVEKSAFVLASTIERRPLIRCEYVRDAHTSPTAHWQVHAERGTFSALLARSGAKAPHDLASLHVPVGGSRFRPGLEDVLEFLVRECGFDAAEGWETAVVDGRQRWRERQLAALVRDAPHLAAEALRRVGYVVSEPPSGAPTGKPESLRRW